jgi:hypothetical protein
VRLLVTPPRTAAAADLAELVPLLARVFPRPRPWPEDLAWAYLGSPAGPARIVNAYAEDGSLLAHYALVPTPPLDDPRFAGVPTYFSLNTAVSPDARVPGLMIATARPLLRAIETEGAAIVLGVANENSATGFIRLLAFRPLGRLHLRFHAPWSLPRAAAPRALRAEAAWLRWRVSRPGAEVFAPRGRGALFCRIRHARLPLDAVLAAGLPAAAIDGLGLPGAPRSAIPAAPRLHASFGPGEPGGFEVPERLRPSPLEYIVRALGAGIDADGLTAFLASRRFEFLDFDVV